MRRTVLTMPSMKCRPNGNHFSDNRRSSAASSRRIRPGFSARPVARYTPCSSQAAKPPAHCPGVVMPEDRLLGADTADERDGPVEERPPVPARRLVEQHLRPAHPLLGGRPTKRLLQLDVVEPVEEGSSAAARAGPSDAREVAVDEVDRHRALTDGRGDPLHRVGTSFAANTPGLAGLQGVGPHGQRPPADVLGQLEVRSGDEEPLAVADDGIPQPVGAREAPMRTNSQFVGSSRSCRSRGPRASRTRGAVPVRGDHLGAEPDLDVVRRPDARDEVLPTSSPRAGRPARA